MKKQAIIIISVIVVIAMLAGMLIPVFSRGKAGSSASNNEEADSETHSSGELPPSIQGIAELLNGDDTSDEDGTTDQKAGASDSDEGSDSDDSEEGSDSGQGGSDSGQGGSGGSSSQQGSQGKAPGGQSSGGNTPSIPTITFPYAIPETGLVVQQIGPYSGYFIEDGSDREVSGVATIVLTNNGGNLDFAGIGIAQGERSLGFSASQIPAGATVIIQEQSGAAFSSDPYYSATATTTPKELFQRSELLVSVKATENNTLSVTNISGKKLSKVTVYFKNYLPDEDVYIGGITYSIELTDLEPETQTDVTANHYDPRYSAVMEVIAEE